ncbi:MAG: nucleoside hydrolase [Deltaproteobacteria bacterium]|nr:nucleoside hydrolase [Deltaproteobacteria bacterium]
MSKRQAVPLMFCLLGSALAGGCASSQKVSPEAHKAPIATKEPVQIIFDTDMSLDVDDVGALALLHALADRGEAEILGVMVSESVHSYDGLWGPPLVDILNTYYGRPNIPIGIYKGAAKDIGVYGHFAEKVVKANFPHDLREAEQAEDATRLYRRLLAAAPYRSVKIVTSGYLTNLNNLLLSMPDDVSPLLGTELVARKVIEWTCAGGRYSSADRSPEINFAHYPETTEYVLSAWPGKITFMGDELAPKYMTGGKLTNTFESTVNPVAMAWQHFNGGQAQRSRDSVAVLYAVRGLASTDGAYFKSVGNGANHYEKADGGLTMSGHVPQAQNVWVAGEEKPHSYLRPAAATVPVTNTIDALITAPPAKVAPLSASH